MMLWGCTVEGNPWLAYSVVPSSVTPSANIFVTVGYNFACMNNAIPSGLPDTTIASSSFNAGTPSSPPVWSRDTVTWPASNWNPSPPTDASGTSPLVGKVSTCFARYNGASFTDTKSNITYQSVTSCNLVTPVQVPSASTPVCLMIVCGNDGATTTAPCGFKATIQVGTNAADALLQSSAASVPIWASLVALLVSLFMF
jgi:hypothetical protein